VPETADFDGGVGIREGNKIVGWNQGDAPRDPLEDMGRIRIRTGTGMGWLAAQFRGMSHSR
jgi:hypothetical protein